MRQRGALHALTRHLAARTGQVLNVAGIASDMGHEARTLHDYQVDLVMETRDGAVAGVEVKAYRYDDRLYVASLDRVWQ